MDESRAGTSLAAIAKHLAKDHRKELLGFEKWTKQSPSGKAVAYKIEGSTEPGFIFSAKMEGRDIVETSGHLKQPTRDGREALRDSARKMSRSMSTKTSTENCRWATAKQQARNRRLRQKKSPEFVLAEAA